MQAKRRPIAPRETLRKLIASNGVDQALEHRN